jgi:undecaprenyl-diphosphatase
VSIKPGELQVRADTAIYNMLQGLRSVVADRAMIAITEFGGALVAGSVTLAVLVWLLWRRAWQAAAYWLAAVGGAGVISIAIKGALHRPRPVPIYSGWDAFSFPSGHATTNAAIYGFLAVLLARDVRPRWQALIAATAALAVTLIGFSRLYLGVHWLSDVIGGIAFGTAWIALLAIAFMRHNPQQLPKISIAVIAIATFVVVGGFQVIRKMPIDLERYAARYTQRKMTTVIWWRDGWRKIPSRRVDLIGELEEPLVLQWAGNLKDLKNRFITAGWHQSTPWSVATALSWLDPVSDLTTLPVLPKLHNGRPETLTLIHVDGSSAHPKARWVLRIWKAELQLTSLDGSTQQLWIGAITQQHFDGIFAPFNFGFEKEEVTVPRHLVADALPTARHTARPDGPTRIPVILAHGPAL